jgi:hypothetical protein
MYSRDALARASCGLGRPRQRMQRSRLTAELPSPALPPRAPGAAPRSLWAGKDEGAFAWLTLNYLLGRLGGPVGKTVAAIDMGGGSIQEAFALEPAHAKSAPKCVPPHMRWAGVEAHTGISAQRGQAATSAQPPPTPARGPIPASRGVAPRRPKSLHPSALAAGSILSQHVSPAPRASQGVRCGAARRRQHVRRVRALVPWLRPHGGPRKGDRGRGRRGQRRPPLLLQGRQGCVAAAQARVQAQAQA